MNEIDKQLKKEMMLASRFVMRPHGHPMVQEDILRKLANGAVSQKELQEEMHVRPGTISETVSKLQDKGYLDRNKSEEDGRAVSLQLTEKGREKLNTLSERENLFSILCEEEKQALKEILTKLNNDWIRREPMPPMGGCRSKGRFAHHPHGGFRNHEDLFTEEGPFEKHHKESDF